MIFLFLFSCASEKDPEFTKEMAHIQYDDSNFWIDRYEFPNQKERIPFAKMSFYDANTHCQEQGKRLCTAYEWRLSCQQGKQLKFVYGDTYRSNKCNTNQRNHFGHTSLMQQQELHAESGQFSNCKTQDGVYDLNGNLEEWVLDDWKGNPGALMGGAWFSYSSYADCSGAYSHQPDYRMPMSTKIESAGARCCWSNKELTQVDISRVSQELLEKAKEQASTASYDSKNEVEWTQGHWIDRYEFPNKKGEYPLVGISWQEAKDTCQTHGKTLCSVSAWEQACLGKDQAPYPYGNDYYPMSCLDTSVQGEPSGAKEKCQSASGAFDMVGSVWEWTNSDLTVPELQDYPEQRIKEIRGGSWYSDGFKAVCSPTVGYPIVGAENEFPDLGFRCCRSEQEEVEVYEPIPSTITCPEDMKAVGEFCIDEFEHPNKKNNIPTSEVNLQDATQYCEKEEKHLCSDKEWLMTCQGTQKRRWSYGNDYEPLRCFHSSAGSIDQAIPSGERKDCQTPEGVNDMTGNLWEWTASGKLRGGNWNFSEGMGQCLAKADPSVQKRSVEYGFRCCLVP